MRGWVCWRWLSVKFWEEKEQRLVRRGWRVWEIFVLSIEMHRLGGTRVSRVSRSRVVIGGVDCIFCIIRLSAHF